MPYRFHQIFSNLPSLLLLIVSALFNNGTAHSFNVGVIDCFNLTFAFLFFSQRSIKIRQVLNFFLCLEINPLIKKRAFSCCSVVKAYCYFLCCSYRIPICAHYLFQSHSLKSIWQNQLLMVQVFQQWFSTHQIYTTCKEVLFCSFESTFYDKLKNRFSSLCLTPVLFVLKYLCHNFVLKLL